MYIQVAERSGHWLGPHIHVMQGCLRYHTPHNDNSWVGDLYISSWVGDSYILLQNCGLRGFRVRRGARVARLIPTRLG